ncbi:sulfite exporter TauE/SafE family protein [Microlunatus ginsengisoli]|uniref:Probable membrane transporter protein n=1 Tax=Microlunatus ginsengisoli TaxID=363863 RepID=A0ABP7A7C8_9ACTN
MTGLEISLWTLGLLVLAAFVAGWVDAVVGGGGLIQLPALLIALPADTPPASILGTNKLSSVWGTATSSITYALKLRPDWRTVLPLVAGSAVGSALGAQAARFLPKQYFTPIVLVALIVVGVYTWRRPELGLHSARKHDGRKHYLLTTAIGLGVGAYDGLLGPGTGSFFVILLVTVLGYGFLEASAKAKIANLVTNLAAIVVFAAHGSVLWVVGLCMGAANLAGGFIGAHMAIRGGNSFVRKVFLIVVAALACKLAWDVVTGLLTSRG